MADYKELLRRAISALPENNGAARRAVYEKARSALVGQLRAIQPPLPARDITQHRLQLEDCIRQVEQEASEAVITLGRDSLMASRAAPAAAPIPTPTPVRIPQTQPEPPKTAEPVAAELPKPVEPPRIVETPRVAEASQADEALPEPEPTPAPPAPTITSIEDIIAQAAENTGAPVEVVKPEDKSAKPDLRSIPSIIAKAETQKAGPTSPVIPPSNVSPLKAPSFEPRRDPAPLAANLDAGRPAARFEPALGNQATARQTVVSPVVLEAPTPIERALSTVREVEVEPDASAAQGSIDRAIEALDREARGEVVHALPDFSDNGLAPVPAEKADDEAPPTETAPQRSGTGLTIFLVVFAILLAGVGGVGFWAWREDYIDLDQMFGQAQAPVVETPVATNNTPTLNPVEPNGPGNTSAGTAADQTDSELSGLQIDDRLEPTPQPVTPTGNETTLPDIGTATEDKGEERLPDASTAAVNTNDPSASVDPAVLAGSQSLLLEASQDGTTGAVPFSGTVEWSEGVDDLGQPTLLATASIPARNLSVDITIRKNSDPSLPASHLMEVDFKVTDTFIGGTIANLPGILLKDQELVPGQALVGASARVVGNSFLFALSAAANDATTNTNLLENRRWMDLAVVYGTGRNAIITLEKDNDAQALFQKVFTAWAQ